MSEYYIGSAMINPYSLQHYGIKGQKWGRRNWQNYDGSYTVAGRQHYGIGNKRKARSYQNKNYSVKQRSRDLSIYGRGGVKRINRSMNRGNSISGARSQEATRIHQARARSTRAGRVGAVIGGIAGYKIGGPAVRTAIALGGTVIGTIFGGSSAGVHVGSQLRYSLEANIGTKMITDYLGVTAGTAIGRNVGRSIGMHSKGYSSKLYRYAN